MSYQALDFHEGEVAMHKLIQNPGTDNPTSPFLTPFAANLLSIAPLLAVGTLDEDNRPWTSIWGGEPGLSRAVAPSVIGIKAMVDRIYDPVVGTLLGVEADGEVVQSSRGKMVAALAIDLQARKRVKLFGRMMAGALSATTEGVGEVQMAVKIEQSLGMYIIDEAESGTDAERQLPKVSQSQGDQTARTRGPAHVNCRTIE